MDFKLEMQKAIWALATMYGLFLLLPSAGAQRNVLVMGKMANVGLVKEIDLEVNERFIDGHTKNYGSKVLDDGTFAFALEVRMPQIVTLTYSRNNAYIYVEPNDTVFIKSDANSFQYSMEFTGRGGANNTYWAKYLRENPIDENAFAYQNYRYGSVWYVNSPRMDAQMKNMGRDEFVKWMLLRKETAKDAFNAYDGQHPNAFTPDFRKFMRAEIDYDWAYHILLYGNVFKSKYKLTDDYFQYLMDTSLQNDQIGNNNYRQYLAAYMNHLYLRLHGDVPQDALFKGQYELAGSQLNEVPLAFFRSDLVARALRKRELMDDFLPIYQHFLENNPYADFDGKVVEVYQKATRYATGTDATDFALRTPDGQEVHLSDYLGKVVYLNFWANWCRACVSKMLEMQPLEREMESEGVVFLNVSFDRTNEEWLAALQKRDFGGVHVIAPQNIDSQVAKDYNVQALPQYYLIDKRGKFAEKPSKPSLDDLRFALRRLVLMQ
jgi:peroxiredoxin